MNRGWAVLALLLATGCGGSEPQGFQTPGDLAEAVGCDGAELTSVPAGVEEVLTAEEIEDYFGDQPTRFTCSTDGHRVDGYWFATPSDLADWDALAALSGPWPRLLGDRWAIQSDQPTVDRLQESLGGEART